MSIVEVRFAGLGVCGGVLCGCLVVFFVQFFTNVTKNNIKWQNSTLSDLRSHSARFTNDCLNTFSLTYVPIKTFCKKKKVPQHAYNKKYQLFIKSSKLNFR